MQRGELRERLASLPPVVRVLAGVALIVVLGAGIAFAALSLSGALDPARVDPEGVHEAAVGGDAEADPFAWDASRRADFERRAALGSSHPLYALSPGGIVASAQRTARFRPQVEEAAEAHGVDPDLIEAMVLLESAGRPDVIAGGVDPANASGLAQIVASTGIDLLGMHIDLPRSQELTTRMLRSEAEAEKLRRRAKRLSKAQAKRKRRQRRRLAAKARDAALGARIATRQRRRIDPRFRPRPALEGMARYLEIAQKRFGAEDLAVVSYHMGIGNLQGVVSSYLSPEQRQLALPDVVAASGLSYAQLFFDSSPLAHRRTWKRLAGFADDSATYYWRVLAAEQVMRLFRDRRAELKRLAKLHSHKATAEEVLHPEQDTPTFADPEELADALDSGELVALPNRPRLGFVVSDRLGELTDDLGVDRRLYRALRPEALAALTYMAGRVQAITGRRGRRDVLRVTSAVRDQRYQDALVRLNGEATPNYSLHTTGYSFDIRRSYVDGDQARAFQFVLDRMRALGVIDYAVEPQAIHVTVSDEVEPLLE